MRGFVQKAGRLVAATGVLVLTACGGRGPSEQDGTATSAVKNTCAVKPIVDRSLFVTDATGLAEFPLEAVLDQIVRTGSTTGQTALGLYQQLFDTLNTKADGVTNGPHCDDETVDGQPAINGFPEQFCPRQEGALAKTNPFNAGPDGGTNQESYVPIGVVNRFDLAPANGDNCGQYRVAFGKISGRENPFDRVLIIFEAVLPNPDTAAGLVGCLPVAQFWDELSKDTSASSRATKLQQFYFQGLSGFSPVISAQNYGFGGGTNTGQIRANMLGAPGIQEWELREFRLSQSCSGTDCTLVANNTFVQTNPYGPLFGGTDAASTAFQQEFLTQIPTLAATTIPTIAMATPTVDDGPQSDEGAPPAGSPTNNDYSQEASSAFLTTLGSKLTQDGISLTAQNILDRATTQSCAGCHELSFDAPLGGGLTWPASNGFTQIDEHSTLSPALKDSFLPFRAQVLTSFLETNCGDASAASAAPVQAANGAKLTIGGGIVGSGD